MRDLNANIRPSAYNQYHYILKCMSMSENDSKNLIKMREQILTYYLVMQSLK